MYLQREEISFISLKSEYVRLVSEDAYPKLAWNLNFPLTKLHSLYTATPRWTAPWKYRLRSNRIVFTHVISAARPVVAVVREE